MAGMFGLFNYEKEGPGVSKNAPRKRAFVRFFEIYARKFWQLLIAGVLWFVVTLPVVTRGWADAGLTFVTRGFSREKHVFIKEDFFATVKKNRGQAFACGLINLLVTAVLFFNFIYYAFGIYPELYGLLGIQEIPQPMELSLIHYVVMAVTSVGYLIFTWMKYYIPFLVITFKLTTKQVYKNAFLFSIAGLKTNLLVSLILIVLYAIPIAIILLLPTYLTIGLLLVMWPLLVMPFRSFLIQFCIFPLIRQLMIDPYYKENPNADKQARLDLNLDIDEAAAEEAEAVEEPVFSDETPAEKEEPTFPKQYNEREMRRFNSRVNNRHDDDDDTI